jgi:outer membrane protein
MRALIGTALAGCIVVPAWAGLALPTQAETLADAIALTEASNPTLQAQRAQLRATDEEYVQAEAGYRPTLTAGGSYEYQDGRVSETGSPSASVAGGTGTAVLTLTQPLYTGGLVKARLSAAQADILAGREGLRRAEIQVLTSVIGAYVDVRRDAEQLKISQDNVAVLTHELEENRAKFGAGLLTRTDVAQSEARLAAARSQLSGAEASLAEARAAYQAVVGQTPGELAPEPSLEALLPGSIDAAFDAALAANPELRQAAFVEAASAAKLAEAKSQTRPTASLSAQYGYVGAQSGVSSGGFGSAANVLETEIGGSVTANVSVPLFTGGLYASQIRQAAENENVSRQGVESARRDALQAVAQAWNQLLGAKASLTADEAQVKANEVAFEGVKREHDVGLRTVLDVLNAQQELETSQIALVGARHDSYVAAAAVLAAIGGLDAKDLAPDAPRYNPKANFERVRHAPGWVPWEGAIGAIDALGAPAADSPLSTAPPLREAAATPAK